MSYTRLYYHIIWGTKYRQPTIFVQSERDMYHILFYLCKEQGAFVHRIGGMPDHIHLLVDVPPTIAVSKFVQYIKHASSEMARKSNKFPNWNGWGEGYGCFSVSFGDIEGVKSYITDQKRHHSGLPYEQEFKNYLTINGIDDEKVYIP